MNAETLNKIISYTRENGGGTFNVSDGSPVMDGYAVARPDMIGGREIKRDNITDAITDMLDESYKWNAEVEILGTWLHGGQCYAEPTSVIADRDEAIAIGTSLGQEAIYNLTTGEEIPLRVAPIMRSRVIVSSFNGYGYGETVAEAKLNHDTYNNLARPITIQELPAGAKWLRNGYNSIYCPVAGTTYEETATAGDILAVTLNRIEGDVQADTDYMIREDEITNDEELEDHAEELPNYVTNALDTLTISNLLTLAQYYASEFNHPCSNMSLKACLVQVLTNVLASTTTALEAYSRGAQAAVSELLEEWEVTDIEVGTDRVEAIVNAMEDEEQ